MNQESYTPTTANKGDMNILARIWNVFVAPAAAFEAVRQKPNWWLPLIASLLITAGCMYFLTPIIMKESKPKMVEQMEKQGLEGEQLDQAVARAETIQKYSITPSAVGGGLAVTFIIAAIWLFVANVLAGGAAKYSQVVGVVVYAGFIGLLGFLIKLPIMISRETMNVHFSLATLMSESAKDTFLYKLLVNVELFNIWTIAASAIGLAIVAGLKLNKVLPWVVILTVLYWVAAAGLGSAFGR